MTALGFGAHVEHGQLRLGGLRVEQLVARAGQSPFYVYLRGALTEQVRRLRAALPPGARLYYSPKVNPMPALVHHLAGLVDGFDVASLGELRVVLDAGAAPGACLFTGPGKGVDEIRAAVACGVVVNLESPHQLDQVLAAGRALGIRPSVTLRLNCGFAPPRADMHDHATNQFGVDVAEAPALLARMAPAEVSFQGFHVFWGSQHHDPEAIAGTQRRAFLLAMSLAPSAPCTPALINVGGGFAAPFFAGEAAFDLEAAGAAIRAWGNAAQDGPGGCRLAFEFGRYLVAGAGYYVCQVLDRKRIGAETFLVVDGGLHHHLLASGAFGQRQRKNFAVVAANGSAAAPAERVHVVGRLCSVMDRLASDVWLPVAAPGDYLVVPSSGAYGASFSPGNFLSHPPVMEMLV